MIEFCYGEGGMTVTKDRDDANKKVESVIGKLEIVKKERKTAEKPLQIRR